MRKLLLLVFLLGSLTAFSQRTVTGTVIDSETQAPLPGANVIEAGTSNGTITDFDGNFTLETKANSGAISISYVGYINKKMSYNNVSGTDNLGAIVVSVDADALDEVVVVGRGVIDLAKDRQTPIAVSTITSAEIQSKAVGNVEFPEAIKSTPSVYVANQSGGFGDSQMFLRGFDQTNTAFLLNGQPINGMEDGKIYWSNWSGMSDIANAIQVQRGLGSSKLAISSVGGTVNIVSRAAGRKEGGFARFMTGNDSYLKGTVSYDSGLKGKWAYSFLVDHWQAHRKYADGTAGQGQNYFVGIGYIPNDKHSFNFLLTGAPQLHDQNFSKTLEKYDEFGKRYNDNSGFYKGERYSFRRNYYHKPVANLNWDWEVSEKTNLSTVLYASWGRGGGTGPLGGSRNIIRNEDNGQINFDAIEANNIAGADNGIGSYGAGSIARRMSVNNHNWYGLLTNLESAVSDDFSVNIGLDTRLYKGNHWQQLNDLMGLQGYTDNFGYDGVRGNDYVLSETFEADPWASLFNSASEGQRYSYDYSEFINYLGGFGQAEYSSDNFSAFIQGAVSTQSYQREGRAPGKELEGVGGLGKSEKVNKFGYNVKGGMGYSFLEGNTVFANAGHYSRQPFLDNIFDDVRNSNRILDGDNEIENEEITGVEVGYRLRSGNFSLDLNGYYTKWGNRFLSNFTVGDASSTDPILQVDRSQRFTGITQVHKGFEFEGKYKYSNDFMIRAFGSIGNWKYDGETPYQIREDQTNRILDEGNVDLTGTKVGNAPQTSFGFGFDYHIFDALSIDAAYNIYTDLYGTVDTKDVIKSALKDEVYQAERLSPYSVLDAGITYKFDFGSNAFTIRGNVYNVTNETYLSQKDSYGVYYGNGRTWNASVRYNF